MPRATWLLQSGSPVIQVALVEPLTGFRAARTLLADTGAAPRHSPFELVLGRGDAQRFGVTQPGGLVSVGGAIAGQFSLCALLIEIPALGLSRTVSALSVPGLSLPHKAEGIAAFRFLNAFCYGNFGDANVFGLESLA